MPEDQNPDFLPVGDFPHQLQKQVMPIIAKVYDEVFPVGTGFVITTSGLMMTAGHVLEAAYDKAVPRRTDDGGKAPYVDLYAIYVANDTHPEDSVGGMWPIDSFWHHPSLDVGVCLLRGATRRETGKPVRWPPLTLSPGIPAIGSKVWAYGYFQMTGSGGQDDDGLETMNFRQSSAYTQGEIVEVHPDYRDEGLLSFPCFRTNARFDPGMSGGPIVNEAGHVCGVVCSSLPPSEDGEEHLSYGSMIWPALMIGIKNASLGGNPPADVTLLDMARGGYIATDDTLNQIHLADQGADGMFLVAENWNRGKTQLEPRR